MGALPSLLAAFSLVAPSQEIRAAEYVVRFGHALQDFECGEYESAARLFGSCGEVAQNAPVWRVHRSVALARSGDLETAKAEAVEALRRGYPVSDLRAIDAALVPDAPVEVDLAPEWTAEVLRLGVDALPGWGDCTIGHDLAVVNGRAWNLVTGELEATQRRTDREIVAFRIHPDDRREPVYERRDEPRWDHVDGSVIEDPWTRVAISPTRDTVEYEDVARFSMGAAHRGLRNGFWIQCPSEGGAPRFLGGARLAVEDADPWPDDPAPTVVPVVDLETFATRYEAVDPLRPHPPVRDEETLDQVEEWLGKPLEWGDRVRRFDGVRELVVTLYGSGRTNPMLVLDPGDGSVVARPKVAPDAWLSFSLGPLIHVPEHALVLTSNGTGSTLEAVSTRTWEVVWREPWSSNNGFQRRIVVRGERVYSWAGAPHHANVNELVTGKSIYDGATSAFTSIDGSDDERWVAASAQGAVHLLDPETFEPYLELWTQSDDGDTPRVRAVAVDGTFDVAAEQIEGAEVLLLRHGLVPAATVAPWLWDPLHVRSMRDDEDRTPRSVKTDAPKAAVRQKLSRADDVAIADDAPIVATVGRNEPLRILNAEDGAVLKTATPDVPWTWNLDVSPNGETVALITRRGEVQMWNWRDDDAPARVTDVGGEPSWTGWPFGCHVSFSPDGERVLVAHHRSERLLLARSGVVVARIPRVDARIELEPAEDGWRAIHASGVSEAVAWSADGSRLALVTEGRPAIHDARTGRRIDVDVSGIEPTVQSVAFGPKGRLLATGHFRGKVVLRDLRTGEERWTHEHLDPFWGKHDDTWNLMGIGDLEFSPDGTSIALTTVTGIYGVLLDVETGKQTWMGSHCGGRMGEPADLTWTDDSSVFYFAYVSGVMPVQRVDLRQDPKRRRRSLPRWKRQFELERGSPIDVGWNGVAVGLVGGEVVAREAVSGKELWRK